MQLIRYDAARHALAECHRIDDAKDIADKALALQAYARQAKDPEMERWVAEIRLRARRRVGELSAALDTGRGANQHRSSDGTKLSALEAAGLSKTEAFRCEQIADVPEAAFEAYIAEAAAVGRAVTADEVTRIVFKNNKNQERAAEIERQVVDLATMLPSAPLGLFHVIAIDPPWPYDDGVTQPPYDAEGHRASNPYPEMSLEEIAAMPIPAADNCVLWLWTTHKFMRHAFPLLDHWGFQERAIVTWCKDRMGLGRWLRSQSEFCVMSTRGKPVLKLTNQTTLLQGPMREHSRKPDEFYEMVDTLCTGRKLDFFSREPREGWEQFGNDTERFALGQ